MVKWALNLGTLLIGLNLCGCGPTNSSALNSDDDLGAETALRLYKEYSRGGDDEVRAYETARLYLEVKVTKSEPDSPYQVALAYKAHVRGYLGSGFSIGTNYGVHHDGKFEKFAFKIAENQGLNNWGYLMKTVDLGQFSEGQIFKSEVGIGVEDKGRIAEKIHITIQPSEKGGLEGVLSAEEIPVEEGESQLGSGDHPHPLRDLTAGEAPYRTATADEF